MRGSGGAAPTVHATRMEATIGDVFQLIYSSQPFGYDEAVLNGILMDARRCNTRDDITGALVCRHDIFLQLLEGPKDSVHATYERIKRDDRHVDVKLRFFGDVPTRMFGNWAMLHDPAHSWLWSSAEIADDALDRASVSDFRHVFQILATQANSANDAGRPTGA